MSVIILLTHRHRLGAEMFVVGRDGSVGRNREDAKRFIRNEAEDFIRIHEGTRPTSVFRDYRMFIDPI